MLSPTLNCSCFETVNPSKTLKEFLTKLRFIPLLCLAAGAGLPSAQAVYIESRTSTGAVTSNPPYSEPTGTWADSTNKSTVIGAPYVLGKGSRYAENAEPAPCFQVQPSFVAGSMYEVDVVVPNDGTVAPDLSVAIDTTGIGFSEMPATTNAFSTATNVYTKLGRIVCSSANPTIRFTYSSGTLGAGSYFYADTVEFLEQSYNPIIESVKKDGTATTNTLCAHAGFSGTFSSAKSAAPGLTTYDPGVTTKTRIAVAGTPTITLTPNLVPTVTYAVEVTVPNISTCSDNIVMNVQTNSGISAHTLPGETTAFQQATGGDRWVTVGTITVAEANPQIQFTYARGTLDDLGNGRLYSDGYRFVAINPAASAVTWSGAGGTTNAWEWSNGKNWIGCRAPNPNGGDRVVFAGTTRLTPSLDGPWSVTAVTFTNGAGAFTIAGTANHSLAVGAITNLSGSNQVINANLAAGGTALTVLPAGTGTRQVNLSGVVSGTAGYKVLNAGTLYLGNNGNTITGPVTVSGSGTLRPVTSAAVGGTGVGAGDITLAGGTLRNDDTTANGTFLTSNRAIVLGTGGGSLYVAAGGTLGYAGTISGTGNALTKTSTGKLTLTGANSYSGNTTITGGTLALGAGGSIANTPLIDVRGGTVFDVASVTGGFVLGATQNLKGNGSVVGAVTANGTLSPGASIGILTFSNSLALAGNLFFEVTKSPSQTNDSIVVTGTLTNAGTGTLTVTNIGATALAGGESFTLFNKPVLNGGALTVTGTLPNGLTWTNKLAVDGSIAVVSPSPTLQWALTNGNTLRFSWGGAFQLQAQTNATGLKLGASNWFDYPGGNTSPITVPIDPANPAAFFRLRSP
jgi:autotransporter-associated beta strand protein